MDCTTVLMAAYLFFSEESYPKSELCDIFGALLIDWPNPLPINSCLAFSKLLPVFYIASFLTCSIIQPFYISTLLFHSSFSFNTECPLQIIFGILINSLLNGCRFWDDLDVNLFHFFPTHCLLFLQKAFGLVTCN